MFDGKRALSALNGRQFNSVEIRRAFEQILFENITEIPAEFRARDLFEMAYNSGWISEKNGVYVVDTREVRV